ncbi:MAG: adenylyl-sulfate reductase [Proteobacteria bacterium]|nr:adenylyl-sulfate reductase [Pseudomonadota bacterium]
MMTSNPFSDLSELIPSFAMQAYVIAMFLLVIGGTILDMIHKKSAQYFFANAKKAEKGAKRTVSGGEKVSMVIATVANEVLTSAEFENPRRRISHLFTMYGFIIFVASTAWLIFGYTSADAVAPTLLNVAWHLGAASLCFGGYWFWFFIRVDVVSEGVKWYDLRMADTFILSCLMMATFALLWSVTMGAGVLNMLFLIAFILSSTVLFSTVMWSKFAHMFFKPAAAFQKRVTRADGSRENLPADFDLTDPAVQAKFPDIPEYMGKNPEYMGHGIRRERPHHY